MEKEVKREGNRRWREEGGWMEEGGRDEIRRRGRGVVR